MLWENKSASQGAGKRQIKRGWQSVFKREIYSARLNFYLFSASSTIKKKKWKAKKIETQGHREVYYEKVSLDT